MGVDYGDREFTRRKSVSREESQGGHGYLGGQCTEYVYDKGEGFYEERRGVGDGLKINRTSRVKSLQKGLKVLFKTTETSGWVSSSNY